MELNYMIGKSIVEVITELPKIEWKLKNAIRDIETRLKTIFLVDYDWDPIKSIEDIYCPVDVSKEFNIKDFIPASHDKRTLTGLIPKVELGGHLESTSTNLLISQ